MIWDYIRITDEAICTPPEERTERQNELVDLVVNSPIVGSLIKRSK